MVLTPLSRGRRGAGTGPRTADPQPPLGGEGGPPLKKLQPLFFLV